jgi:hypothetical protein
VGWGGVKEVNVSGTCGCYTCKRGDSTDCASKKKGRKNTDTEKRKMTDEDKVLR